MSDRPNRARHSEFVVRARSWAARPPRRSAAEAAAIARRAAGPAPEAALRRWPLGVAILAAAAVAWIVVVPVSRPPAAVPATVVGPPPEPAFEPGSERIVVVELESGTHLYLVLNTTQRENP